MVLRFGIGGNGMVRGRKTVRSVSMLSLGIMLSVALILGVSPGVQAWGNGGYSSDPSNPDYGIHDWIAEEALGLQTLDVGFLTTTYHTEYLYGTEWPDNTSNIGDSFNHIFYYYSTGLVQNDVCADRAQAMYDQALGYLISLDFRNAAYYIGAMTHYVADVGVFGHTMGAPTDWGTEVHHTDYETWFNDNIGSLSSPTGILLLDVSAYEVTSSLAFDITFGDGPIRSNVWMDANYNELDPEFVTSALASLNASVEAVGAAINHLILEAGAVIPEFGSPTTVVLVLLAVMVVVMLPRCRSGSSRDDGFARF